MFAVLSQSQIKIFEIIFWHNNIWWPRKRWHPRKKMENQENQYFLSPGRSSSIYSFDFLCMYTIAHSDDERIDIVVFGAKGDRRHLAKLQLVLLRVEKCHFLTKGKTFKPELYTKTFCNSGPSQRQGCRKVGARSYREISTQRSSTEQASRWARWAPQIQPTESYRHYCKIKTNILIDVLFSSKRGYLSS